MEIRRLWPTRLPADRKAWKDLLHSAHLHPEQAIDEVYGLESQGELLATAAIFGSVIKCVALAKKAQGGPVFHQLLSFVLQRLHQQGHEASYVYTKKTAAFEALGFKKLAAVPESLVLMERSMNGLPYYLKGLQEKKRPGTSAAMVLHANPLTLGHCALIDFALKHYAHAHIFLLSEDRGAFPHWARRKILESYIQDFKTRLTLHETGPYLVSSQSFPSYFIQEKEEITKIQAQLDARLFKEQIAPTLQLDARILGTEPHSRPTALYNAAMEEVFASPPRPHWPKLHILERHRMNGGPISASRVRKLLSEGKLKEAKSLLPKASINFLMTCEGREVITSLRRQNNP